MLHPRRVVGHKTEVASSSAIADAEMHARARPALAQALGCRIACSTHLPTLRGRPRCS